MIRRPPGTTRPDTLFPSTTLCRLWADGTIRVLRLSWYLDPAGQPAGLYAAFDFRGDRKDGTMDCGYIVVHRAQPNAGWTVVRTDTRSEEHTSELQSLMRISYAVFCLKKKKSTQIYHYHITAY